MCKTLLSVLLPRHTARCIFGFCGVAGYLTCLQHQVQHNSSRQTCWRRCQQHAGQYCVWQLVKHQHNQATSSSTFKFLCHKDS